MKNFFTYLITFVIALFFIMLGIISIMLPWSPNIRTDLVQFILEDSVMIFLFGFALMVIGVAIVVNVLLGFKHHYYEIRSKNHAMYIDESLFQDYLNTYWKHLFPNQDIPNRVTIKRNKVHVIADLPPIPLNEQKAIIQRVESDLSDIFTRLIGYRNEYIISISFQKEAKKV
jgi:hypothetical protein